MNLPTRSRNILRTSILVFTSLGQFRCRRGDSTGIRAGMRVIRAAPLARTEAALPVMHQAPATKTCTAKEAPRALSRDGPPVLLTVVPGMRAVAAATPLRTAAETPLPIEVGTPAITAGMPPATGAEACPTIAGETRPPTEVVARPAIEKEMAPATGVDTAPAIAEA